MHGATARFHGGNLNDQPARCARPPASGPELVRQEAAEDRVGALGGQLVLADLAAICAAILDALTPRFVGSAELQVRVVVQLVRDGWPVV